MHTKGTYTMKKTTLGALAAALAMIASPALADECCKGKDCPEAAAHTQHRTPGDTADRAEQLAQLEHAQKEKLRAHFAAHAGAKTISSGDSTCADCDENEAKHGAAVCEPCAECDDADCAHKA